MSNMMPALFLGHGNPMNAISSNAYTEAWSALGKALPRPQAILAVSAHWYLPACEVTVAAQPRTIHDFGGFPPELYQVHYPAPGSPELAARVQKLLSPLPVGADSSWGLDHGTWSVLCHLYPKADIPVVQLSIDDSKPPEFHYELGKQLGSLREEGVLVVGSGNLVHNLHTYAWGRHMVEPYDWAIRFEKKVRDLIDNGDHQALVDYESLGRDAMLAAPTPDHYLPFLYVLGLRRDNERASYPVEGVDGGSVSMLAVQFG